MTCLAPQNSRRRLFWATQPDACGTETECGTGCGRPGFTKINDGRQISTEDWVRGIVINMLMTDAKLPDNECGYRPGGQGGHWSESYILGGPAEIGTLMRTVPAQGRIQDSINLIAAHAEATLRRLVDRGVAISVSAEGSYIGASRMRLDVTVYGREFGTSRVGLTGARLSNGWVWQ